jgi:hypothetical protein
MGHDLVAKKEIKKAALLVLYEVECLAVKKEIC